MSIIINKIILLVKVWTNFEILLKNLFFLSSDPDPRCPKNPDPYGSGSATLVQTILRIEISSWNFHTRYLSKGTRVCFFSAFFPIKSLCMLVELFFFDFHRWRCPRFLGMGNPNLRSDQRLDVNGGHWGHPMTSKIEGIRIWG